MLRTYINSPYRVVLAISICLCLIPISLSVASGADSQKASVSLTKEEQAWLQEHPLINVVDDFVWPPYVYQDKDGKLAGLASSYIELFTQVLGIEFVPQFGLSWNQAIEKFKSSQSDFLPALVRTKEREEFIAFTKPFISFPVVVTTRSDSPFIDNLNDLVGQRVGVVEGYLNQKRLSEQYPDLLVIPIANVAKGIEALAEKEIDAFVGNLGVVYYEKHRLGLDAVIKVAAPTPFIDDLSFGVRKDWPELVSILNKILASMTDREKKAIKHDWIGVTVEFGTPFSTIFKWAVPILLISLAIFIFIVVSNRRLEREVEARYRTEIALKAAKEIAEKASLAKSIFLTNMSHELRTPLNAILGFSRMMGLDSEASSAQIDRLAIINRAGEHLLVMINGVLDLAKIESGQIQLELKQFDLPQLLEDIGQMFGMRAEDAGLSFDQVIEPSVPHYIKSDDGKLRQILINLLGNAIKFTTEGGVSLRASTYPIKGSPEMVILQLEVEDSGLGILPEQQERIFDPFVQGTSHSNTVRGTGLGLTISKSFIDLMEGAIDVESEPGKGTLFRIELPMALADAPDLDELVCSAPIVTGLESGQPPWRILIVEDNPDSRLLLLDLLTQVDFEVKEAENGKQAIALFNEWHPHFIWMNLRMPMMDGYETARQIRRLPDGDQVRIVALTASVLRGADHEAMTVGFDDIMYKPFKEQDIFQSMGDQLGVRYLYQETTTSKDLPQTGYENEELVFAAMHAKVKKELYKAAECHDDEALQKIIARLREIDPAMAQLLKVLVRDQRYDQIQELLE